jgi:hypothetical protein
MSNQNTVDDSEVCFVPFFGPRLDFAEVPVIDPMFDPKACALTDLVSAVLSLAKTPSSPSWHTAASMSSVDDSNCSEKRIVRTTGATLDDEPCGYRNQVK